jgi:hypothetical protein
VKTHFWAILACRKQSTQPQPKLWGVTERKAFSTHTHTRNQTRTTHTHTTKYHNTNTHKLLPLWAHRAQLEGLHKRLLLVVEEKETTLSSLALGLCPLLTFNIAGLDLLTQLASCFLCYTGFCTVCFIVFICNMICEYLQSHVGSQALLLRPISCRLLPSLVCIKWKFPLVMTDYSS